MPSLFLSHSSNDKFFARKLAEKLSQVGVKVWIDEAELRIGDSLLEKISSAIQGSDFVGAVLSHNSVKSNWVQKELAMAMDREIGGKQVVVLPILIESCTIPPFLADKLYADFTDPDDFDRPFLKVLHALGVSIPTTPEPPAEPKAIPKPAAKPKSAPKTATEDQGLLGFDNISIQGIDKSKLYRPDPEKSLYHVYFELSGNPPREWAQIFEAERQFPRHSMWRHAWIEGRYIVVHCVPDEVKKYHLADIKQDVESSNAKYRDYLRRLAAQKAREAQQEKRIKDDLDDALDDLNI
ncbi:MAG: toll/interleukin-1 receptor domain-containing protein [Verrucomicrobiales bacterium]|nr:toll/interleukin-1 receptor domain-containing protein [Verrucomicrobiales bacterium]